MFRFNSSKERELWLAAIVSSSINLPADKAAERADGIVRQFRIRENATRDKEES